MGLWATTATCHPDLYSLACCHRMYHIFCLPDHVFTGLPLWCHSIFFPFFPSHMYTHMCACACRLKVDARNDPYSLPSYSLSRVSQSNSELTDMASFISQIVLGILFLPSETGMTGGPPNWLAFRWVLGIWTLIPTLSQQMLLTTKPSPQPQ